MTHDSPDSELLAFEAQLQAMKPVEPDFSLFQRIALELEPAPVLQVVPAPVNTATTRLKLPILDGQVPAVAGTNQVTATFGKNQRRWKPVAASAAAAAVVGLAAGVMIKRAPEHNGLALSEGATKAPKVAVIEAPQMKTLPAGVVHTGTYMLMPDATSEPRSHTFSVSDDKGAGGASQTSQPSGWVRLMHVYQDPRTGEQYRIEEMRPRQAQGWQ
jgi:hypothetical protein